MNDRSQLRLQIYNHMMKPSDAGKGDDTRPRSPHVTLEKFGDEYDRIFRHGKYAKKNRKDNDDGKRKEHIND